MPLVYNHRIREFNENDIKIPSKLPMCKSLVIVLCLLYRYIVSWDVVDIENLNIDGQDAILAQTSMAFSVLTDGTIIYRIVASNDCGKV